MSRRAVALVGFLVALTGCASAGGPSQPPDEGAIVDATGVWQMSSGVVDGVGFAIVPEAPITMTVRRDEIQGRAACNHYGGQIVVQDGRPRFSLTSMTAMGCAAPVMAAEAAFVAAIPRVVEAARNGDRLVLSGPGVELTFDALPPVPVAGLVGTDWVLESLVSGEAISSVLGEAATLRLEADGTFSGSTGCRTFKGRWIEANGGITPTDLGMDGECPPELADQDGHVVGVLDGFRASIDGDVLTLTGNAGEGLSYRAVRPNR